MRILTGKHSSFKNLAKESLVNMKIAITVWKSVKASDTLTIREIPRQRASSSSWGHPMNYEKALIIKSPQKTKNNSKIEKNKESPI